MHANNRLVPEKFGFWKGVSTEDATFKLRDKVLNIFTKNACWRNFVTFKAFDCENHEILFSKLHFYGIQGIDAKWFRSYLTDRKQKVEVKSLENNHNFFSNWEQ
jgi:hypothetical protein